MIRLLETTLILALALLAGACRTATNGGPGATAPPAKGAIAAPISQGPYEEDLSLARKEDFLTLVHDGVPNTLKNTVEIRDYKFELTRIEELPEVSLELFNLLDNHAVNFEIRTLFFREDNSVIDATEWVRATAPPRGSYRYRAVAWSPFAKSEQVQIRLLHEGAETNS